MKLCSICDKRIEGTWCKSCKRFVKTYDISNDIHLNESHDLKNDAGCTYHTSMTTARTTSTGTNARSVNGGTNTYRTTTTQTSRTTTSTAKNPAQKSKAGKIIAIIICVYVALALFGSVVPLVINGVIENVFSDTREKEEDSYEIDVDVDTPEIDVSAAQLFLASVKPVDTEVYEEGGTTYTYSYYDPETIAITDISCDAFHFDFEIDELDELLEVYFWDRENWYTEEKVVSENNYLMEYNETAWAYFETDRYYVLSESLDISVDYDTASGELHGISFAADMYDTQSEDYYAIYHALLQELDPEYDDSKISLARKIERAAQEAGDEYGEVDASEQVGILVKKDKYGNLLIAFFPL